MNWASLVPNVALVGAALALGYLVLAGRWYGGPGIYEPGDEETDE